MIPTKLLTEQEKETLIVSEQFKKLRALWTARLVQINTRYIIQAKARI